MNSYEAKREARRERYLELADKKRAASLQSYTTATKMADMIPFGQPILVGHHSEGRHRRAIEKINNSMRKSIDLEKTANYYQDRADNISNNISSDDPEAVEKLKIKLARLEDRQADMKEQNAEARANKVEQPFEKFMLTNNGAVIRGVKLRIAQLTAKQETKVNEDIIGSWGVLHEDKEENRIQFIFDSIPSEEVRGILKGRGFRWSPTNKAWQRQLNSSGRYAAKFVLEKL